MTIRKTAYIAPASCFVPLRIEGVLATSVTVDKSTDVDDSDKSASNPISDSNLWEGMDK